MQAHPPSRPAARNPSTIQSFPHPLGPSSLAEGPGLAHDAGNLLGALGLYCDLLDAPGVLRPEHLHYARELRMLSQRSQAMIQRLLEGGHEPAGRGQARVRCPASAVRQLLPLLRSIAQPDATILADIQPGVPALPFDCEPIERILVNLTRNAATALRVKARRDRSTAAGEVRIRLSGASIARGRSRVRLTVADNGPGLPLAVAGALLRPRPMAPGTTRGFGHRIVHELIAATGGTLEIVVTPGRGTSLHMDWEVAGRCAGGLKSEAAC